MDLTSIPARNLDVDVVRPGQPDYAEAAAEAGIEPDSPHYVVVLFSDSQRVVLHGSRDTLASLGLRMQRRVETC